MRSAYVGVLLIIEVVPLLHYLIYYFSEI